MHAQNIQLDLPLGKCPAVLHINTARTACVFIYFVTESKILVNFVQLDCVALPAPAKQARDWTLRTITPMSSSLQRY